MTYEMFPAVDEDFNFPVEVRQQLAKSEQLRNLLIPMDQTTRDSLTEDDIWFGRTIYNLTSEKIEVWTSPGVWLSYLDETYSFPQPPPFWDENFDIPVEVRQQLAKSEQLRNMIVPMTQEERNSLTSSDRWNGRTIFNTTNNILEVWQGNIGRWLRVLDETWDPPMTSWEPWQPLLSYHNSPLENPFPYYNIDTAPAFPHNYTSFGFYNKMDKMVNAYFKISFFGNIVLPTTETKPIYCNMPEPNLAYNLCGNGRAIYSYGSETRYGIIVSHTASSGLKCLAFLMYDSGGNLTPVTNRWPKEWSSTDDHIYGHVSYPLEDIF